MSAARKILITGAGSGLGEGAAIGLARAGHAVIAAAQVWPQVTALRAKAAEAGLGSLRVEKLDLLDPYEVKQAVSWDFDVLVNNAGIGEGGPIAEIPIELVRHNFEVNVFAPLALTQQVVRKWVRAGIPGKVVFVSSMGGSSARPGSPATPRRSTPSRRSRRRCRPSSSPSASKCRRSTRCVSHRLQRGDADNALRWLDDDVHFTRRAAYGAIVTGLIGNAEGRLDPADMIARWSRSSPRRPAPSATFFPPSSRSCSRPIRRRCSNAPSKKRKNPMPTSQETSTKPAYFVAEVEIHDLAGFTPYAEQFAGTVAPFGGKVVAFGESIEPIEGIEKTTARAAIVVFPSAQARRDWFASPAYRKIAPLRQKSAHTALFPWRVCPAPRRPECSGRNRTFVAERLTGGTFRCRLGAGRRPAHRE